MKKVDKINFKNDLTQTDSKNLPAVIHPGQDTLSPKLQTSFEITKFNLAVTVVSEAICTLGNIFSYLSEKERTKQVIAEVDAKVFQAKLELERVKILESNKRAEIISKHQLEMEKIENERKKIETLKKVVDDTLETIRLLRVKLQEKEDEQILNKLHEQQLKLIDVAKSIAEM